MKTNPLTAFLQSRGAPPHLINAGAAGLLTQWQDIVNQIQTGYRFDLDNYLNDMDLRQIIHEAFHLFSPHQQNSFLHLDQQAKPHLRPSPACIQGQSAAQQNHWTPQTNWWYFMLPPALAHPQI